MSQEAQAPADRKAGRGTAASVRGTVRATPGEGLPDREAARSSPSVHGCSQAREDSEGVEALSVRTDITQLAADAFNTFLGELRRDDGGEFTKQGGEKMPNVDTGKILGTVVVTPEPLPPLEPIAGCGSAFVFSVKPPPAQRCCCPPVRKACNGCSCGCG